MTTIRSRVNREAAQGAGRAGMTPVVKITARLVAGFIVVFAVYIAATGHLSPGGGFAGGVILAAAAVLVVLAFGRSHAVRVLTETLCHAADAAGALAFWVIALLGFGAGAYFANFLPPGQPHHLASGGTIALSNVAILVKVGAGLVGVFLALAGYGWARRNWTEPDETTGAEVPGAPHGKEV